VRHKSMPKTVGVNSKLLRVETRMPCQTVLLRTMCPCAPTMAASTPTSGFVRRSKKEEYRKYLAF